MVAYVKDRIIVNSNSIVITIRRKKKATLDDWLKAQKDFLGSVLIFETCPKCKREVPKIDMTTDDVCCFCLERKKEKPT